MDKAKVNKWLNALNDNSYNKAAVLSAAAASLLGAAPAGRCLCCRQRTSDSSTSPID